jgi:hypothetical protein
VWKVRRANSARGSIRKSNLRSRLCKPPSQIMRAGARTIVSSSLERTSERSDHWVHGP